MGSGCTKPPPTAYAPTQPGRKEVSIWWDFENLTPASGRAASVVAALRAIAARDAPGCAVTSFTVFVDSKNGASDGQLADLTEQGIDCVHSVANSHKRAEASDKAIAVGLLLWLLECGDKAAAVMLVTGDSDFAPLLSKLADKQRVRVLLVTPLTGQRRVRPALLNCGAMVSDWNLLVPAARGPEPAAPGPESAAEQPLPKRANSRARSRPGRGRGGGAIGADGGSVSRGSVSINNISSNGAAPAGAPAYGSTPVSGGIEQQLARARLLLSVAGAQGIPRRQFREQYLRRYGEAFTAGLDAGALRKGQPRGQGLGHYLENNSVAVLVDRHNQRAARFVAPNLVQAGGGEPRDATVIALQSQAQSPSDPGSPSPGPAR
ncbi:hypothetical protein T492DRAFT_965060 [Pavlovales sp. CCMP2436]|nr:hypothetical protein T492DRAFT_965060 [Pavlovales sp. CCMP2436]